MYQRIGLVHWRHVYICGDLHGCYHMLTDALAEQRFDRERDLLVCVGDLIDRGPQSLACLRLLDEEWFRAVRGNHEEMAIAALHSGETALWTFNGGDWFLHLGSQERQEARTRVVSCASLPLILELDGAGWRGVVAHADYPAPAYAWKKPLNWQQVVWSRERLRSSQAGEGATIDGARAFWFGHTPLEAPFSVWNQHYIDTGAVFGGRLTLVKVQ